MNEIYLLYDKAASLSNNFYIKNGWYTYKDTIRQSSHSGTKFNINNFSRAAIRQNFV